MNNTSSLNQFFSEIDCHFQCYNMGRKIYTVKNQTFIDFENTQTPWAAPFLQHAWIALLFWKKDNENKHHVWFLKLPLDEQAKLNLAARDDFLRHLFETLGETLGEQLTRSHDTTPEKLHALENTMKDSPYGFQPKPEQLANFHAMAHRQLSLPASSFYKSTQNYLSNRNKSEEWSELGFQGFADLCARLDEQAANKKTNEQLINESVSHLPIEPLQVLGLCLENHHVSKQTTNAFYQRLKNDLDNNDATISHSPICIASIRATSQTSDQQLQIQLLSDILASPAKADIEVLANIASRCWLLISHEEILLNYLEALALVDVQHPGAFKAILSDLMFIPDMRETILPAFRNPVRSQQLAQAIGTFFSSI